MFCNDVMWCVVRYGVESLGIRLPEATEESEFVLEGWESILEIVVTLLGKYHNIAKGIVKKAGTFLTSFLR